LGTTHDRSDLLLILQGVKKHVHNEPALGIIGAGTMAFTHGELPIHLDSADREAIMDAIELWESSPVSPPN
jgi:hypothetical protein